MHCACDQRNAAAAARTLARNMDEYALLASAVTVAADPLDGPVLPARLAEAGVAVWTTPVFARQEDALVLQRSVGPGASSADKPVAMSARSMQKKLQQDARQMAATPQALLLTCCDRNGQTFDMLVRFELAQDGRAAAVSHLALFQPHAHQRFKSAGFPAEAVECAVRVVQCLSGTATNDVPPGTTAPPPPRDDGAVDLVRGAAPVALLTTNWGAIMANSDTHAFASPTVAAATLRRRLQLQLAQGANVVDLHTGMTQLAREPRRLVSVARQFARAMESSARLDELLGAPAAAERLAGCHGGVLDAVLVPDVDTAKVVTHVHSRPEKTALIKRGSTESVAARDVASTMAGRSHWLHAVSQTVDQLPSGASFAQAKALLPPLGVLGTGAFGTVFAALVTSPRSAARLLHSDLGSARGGARDMAHGPVVLLVNTRTHDVHGATSQAAAEEMLADDFGTELAVAPLVVAVKAVQLRQFGAPVQRLEPVRRSGAGAGGARAGAGAGAGAGRGFPDAEAFGGPMGAWGWVGNTNPLREAALAVGLSRLVTACVTPHALLVHAALRVRDMPDTTTASIGAGVAAGRVTSSALACAVLPDCDDDTLAQLQEAAAVARARGRSTTPAPAAGVLTVMELAPLTLSEFVFEVLPAAAPMHQLDLLNVALFQLVHGLVAAQLCLGLQHNDFHSGNAAMVYVRPETWQYTVPRNTAADAEATTFRVPTCGMSWKPLDMGMATSTVLFGDDDTALFFVHATALLERLEDHDALCTAAFDVLPVELFDMGRLCVGLLNALARRALDGADARPRPCWAVVHRIRAVLGMCMRMGEESGAAGVLRVLTAGGMPISEAVDLARPQGLLLQLLHWLAETSHGFVVSRHSSGDRPAADGPPPCAHIGTFDTAHDVDLAGVLVT